MSTSISLLSEDDLKKILIKSQANNTVNQLTGMLLYSQGTFVQVLEGNTEDLDETYVKITKDKRHKNIIKLAEGTIEERLFPNWSMGFKAVTTDDISRFAAYTKPKQSRFWNDDDSHPAITILKTFAETNYL
jgi:hypothetical protein